MHRRHNDSHEPVDLGAWNRTARLEHESRARLATLDDLLRLPDHAVEVAVTVDAVAQETAEPTKRLGGLHTIPDLSSFLPNAEEIQRLTAQVGYVAVLGTL